MFNFAQISNRHIGKITLDVVTTEEHTSELSITDNQLRVVLKLPIMLWRLSQNK